MSAHPWSRGRISGKVGAIPTLAGSHDRIKTDRAGADCARRADAPRQHLGGLGFQLARHENPAERTAAADLARLDRRDRGGAAGSAGAGARAEPQGRAAFVATPDAVGAAQRHGLDGADGAGTALAAGDGELDHSGLILELERMNPV